MFKDITISVDIDEFVMEFDNMKEFMKEHNLKELKWNADKEGFDMIC